MLKLKTEIKLSGECKCCGKKVVLWKPFYNHLAYEHGVCVSKWYKFKAFVNRLLKKCT